MNIPSDSVLLSLAWEIGLHKTAVIPVSQIQFNPSFRSYCEENKCGNYNNNYSCPPDCGSQEDMKNRVLRYKNALVMQSTWKYDSLSNTSLLKKYKLQHIELVDKFLQKVFSSLENLSAISHPNNFPDSFSEELLNEPPDELSDGLLVSAGPCMLCEPCAKTKGEPCRFPEKKNSCLSAYCIDAAALAASAGMTCWYEDNTVAYFSVYIYS